MKKIKANFLKIVKLLQFNNDQVLKRCPSCGAKLLPGQGHDCPWKPHD